MLLTFRLLLAALHFNENTQRQQQTSKNGEAQFVVSYQKFDTGRGVVKEVKVPCTYGMYSVNIFYIFTNISHIKCLHYNS